MVVWVDITTGVGIEVREYHYRCGIGIGDYIALKIGIDLSMTV